MPVGVVAATSIPWKFPFDITVGKVHFPALLAGPGTVV